MNRTKKFRGVCKKQKKMSETKLLKSPQRGKGGYAFMK